MRPSSPPTTVFMHQTPHHLPEIVFDTNTSFTPAAVAQLVKRGEIQRLGPKVYTSSTHSRPEQVVRRNIFLIAGHLWPGAVVSWRTAFEQTPSPDGSVYLSYHSPRKMRLPGHTLKLIQAHGPLDGDKPYAYDLHRSSPARAFLENLAARRRERWGWAVSKDSIENQLRAIKDPLTRRLLGDRARELAVQFGWYEELKQLQALLEQTAPTTTDAATAKPVNEPPPDVSVNDDDYDAARLRSLETLLRILRERTYRPRPCGKRAPGWHINRAFFETYCSNYLAGLEFEIEAAHQVIIDMHAIAERPMDSTVLLNNYRLVQQGDDLHRLPHDGDDLLALLKMRHARLFTDRDDQAGGCFRRGDELTDSTRFIAASKVRGTLRRGFELYSVLQEPFTRAVFMLYLIRECHPFDSGSGRIARVMMNAELTAGDERRILIPPVYCGDYWLGLRALARENNPEPFVRALTRAHAFSAAIQFDTYQLAYRQWQERNAFMASDPRMRMHEV